MKNIKPLMLAVLLSFGSIKSITKTDIAAMAAIVSGGLLIADGIYTKSELSKTKEIDALNAQKNELNKVAFKVSINDYNSMSDNLKALCERHYGSGRVKRLIDINDRLNYLNELSHYALRANLCLAGGAVLAVLGVHKLIKGKK